MNAKELIDSPASLTLGENERLTMLAEECAEVIQAITKIQRHGYFSFHPDNPEVSNLSMLRQELKDLDAVRVMIARDLGMMPERGSPEIQALVQKKLKYTHHQ